LQEAGMTILISSHVLSDLAELCSSVGIMEMGFLVESTSLRDLYARLSRQQIAISTLGSMETLHSELRHCPHVQDWETLPEKHGLRVNFSGTPEDSAELLRSLVHAGLPISEFHSTQEDLESIFLKLGHKQAS
ncbi:MAG: ABC transporter ATP-binding protein, partial [Cyanobacteriota bacterium]|nr:ABC transporter ATP-binding protein [Cyanobacteriota bacterium]